MVKRSEACLKRSDTKSPCDEQGVEAVSGDIVMGGGWKQTVMN